MTFLLKRIVTLDFADDDDFVGAKLKGLLHFRRQNDMAFDSDGSAGKQMGDDIVIGEFIVIDDLDAFKAGSVIERDKTDGARIAVGTDPTFDKDFA